jgi:hypothetical protein
MATRRRNNNNNRDGFNLTGAVGTAIIGLMATLIGTGLVSMITLYTRVSTLTDDVVRTEQTLAKHLDHSVDRDDYLRRDTQIQKALDQMATKEDLRQLRITILEMMSSKDPQAAAEKYR